MAYDGTLKFDTKMDTSGFQSGANSLGNIVKGMTAFKLLEKGFQAVVEQMDAAISRYDTIEKFPEVMQQMGFSATETSSAMEKLSEGVMGLPTALDDVVSSTQRMASMTGDLENAADLTLALNNAFLASGSSSDAASRGMEQYMQIVSRGTPEMEDWKTLQETMPYALQQVAEAFGYAGTSATRDFYSALQDGEITVEEMNAKFIELSTATGGFAETAKTAVGGIGTALTNFQQAITRGLVNVLDAVDEGLSTTKFKSIENVIQSAGNGVKKALDLVAVAAKGVTSNLVPLTAATVTMVAAWNAAKFLSLVGQLGSVKSALAAMLPAVVKLTAAKVSEAAATTTLNAIYAQNAIVTALMAVKQAIATKGIQAQTAATTGGVIAQAAYNVVCVAAAAAQSALNAAMLANPIGLVVAAIVAAVAVVAALTAGIMALVGAFGSSNEAYKAEKKEIEDLADAHEQYNEQLASDKTAAEQSIHEIQAQADANKELVGSLDRLISKNDEAGKNNEQIAATVDELNEAYEDLNLTYDETTNTLSTSTEELEAYVKAKNDIAQQQAQEEEYSRLLEEQTSLQAKMNIELERQEEIRAKLASGEYTDSQANKLLEESIALCDEYGETMDGLSSDVEAAQNAIDKSVTKSAKATVNAYEAMNGATDENGKNIKQLAHAYDVSTDEILDAMEEQEQTLAEWSESQADAFTEEGQSLKGVATQWGMTTEEVKGYMEEWGMNLDEFAEEMEDTHTEEGLSLDQLAAKWGTTTEAIKAALDNTGMSLQEWSDSQDEAWEEYEDSIQEHAGNIINSFKALPDEFDMTAEEMLQNLIDNKTKYAEWEAAMEEITLRLGPTAAAEFESLGVGATDAINEILASPELLNGYAEALGVKIDEATGVAIEEWNDPEFIGAASNALNKAAEEVNNNTSVETALNNKMANLKTAGGFTAALDPVGGEITSSIANGINSSEITGAMGKVSTAISGSQGQITSATKNVADAATSEMRQMKTQSVSNADTMMSSINSSIVSKSGTVKSSASSLASGVVTNLEPMVSGARSVTNSMMDGILSAMNSRASSLYAKANEIASNIAATMANALDVHSPSRVMIKLFENVMMGIYEGMDGMSGMLYKKAEDISDGLAERLSFADGVSDAMRGIADYQAFNSAYAMPELAFSGAGGTQYITSLTQNITTPKALSASEMTKEGQDLLKRSRWQLP